MKIISYKPQIMSQSIDGDCKGSAAIQCEYYYNVTPYESGYEFIVVGHMEVQFYEGGLMSDVVSQTFHVQDFPGMPTVEDLLELAKRIPDIFNDFYNKEELLYSSSEKNNVWKGYEDEINLKLLAETLIEDYRYN